GAGGEGAPPCRLWGCAREARTSRTGSAPPPRASYVGRVRRSKPTVLGERLLGKLGSAIARVVNGGSGRACGVRWRTFVGPRVRRARTRRCVDAKGSLRYDPIGVI